MSPKAKRRVRLSKTPPASGRKPGPRLSANDLATIADDLAAYPTQFRHIFRRREPRRWSTAYLFGQLSNLERKTIEAIGLEFYGADQDVLRALQQFVGESPWDAQAMMQQLQELVAQTLGDPDAILIVDGSGFPKQGTASAGVAHQYCGHVGKVTNCQEGVFAVYYSEHGYAFLEGQLYLPPRWFGAEYRDRWQQCGIPAEVSYQTEPALALGMIQAIAARGRVPFRWVAGDEQFGGNPGFLDGVDALGYWYLAEVPSDTRIWLRRPRVDPPGYGPTGRWRSKPRVAGNAPAPQELRTLATHLPASAWTRYRIKEGSKGPLVAEFAFLRVTVLRDDLPGPRLWAVLRRQVRAPHEVKFYLSNAPTTCPRSEFVRVSGLRWPIETAFEEVKGEVGMDHYETRSWQGWHHHMAQTFVAHFFLVQACLKLKKKSGVDDRADAPPGGAGDCGRVSRRARRTGRRSLSPMAQPGGLSLPSQAYAQASLRPVIDYAKVS